MTLDNETSADMAYSFPSQAAAQYFIDNVCGGNGVLSSYNVEGEETRKRIYLGEPDLYDIVATGLTSEQICDTNNPHNLSGVGYDYAWTNSSQYTAVGYIYDMANMSSSSVVYNNGVDSATNLYHVIPSNVEEGTYMYQPYQSFNALVGCPFNGTWTISVCDSWANDNGYVFDWEIALYERKLDSTYGYVSGNGTYAEGTEVSFSATPTEHYHFVQWSDGNTDNPRTITVIGDTTYTATFAIDQHTVMVVSNNSTKGTVSGGGTFDYGEEREIEAIANEGYRFLSWNDNNTDNPRTITVSGDTLYIATFEVDNTPQPVYVTIADTACGRYNWNDSTYTQSGAYYQTFTASSTADSIVRLDLVIYPLPQPEISINGILDACNPESASVTLSTGEYEEYNWSTGETTGTATVTAPGQYYVEVVDTNGCRGLSEMATVGYSSLLTVAPQLKYVGLRYSGTVGCNIVQWTVTNTEGVHGYDIYRENTETGVYELAKRIDNPSKRSWIDPDADLTARAYRYKICSVDECGGMSPMSEPHKTMHLTINRGVGTDWNLIWSHYEGIEYSTYQIYRGTSSRNMVMIAEIPSSLNSFTDNSNTMEEGMFYQIKIVGGSGAKNEEFELCSNVVANEYVDDYTISVLSNNEDFGVAAGSGTYPAGLDVTLMAIPNDGYDFVSWSDGSTENPRVVTVSENAAYVATFGEASSSVTNYTITAVSANLSQGTVTGGGVYQEGAVVEIEAVANEGYEFASWSDGSTENPRQITVTEDMVFVASFTEIAQEQTFTITAVSANPSQGTVTGGGVYQEGAVVEIEAVANEGYEFASWDDGSTENPRQITVTADSMFIASFVPMTGIEENFAAEINVFPNPASNVLNITSSETISEIEIVNVMGQVVKRIEVNADNAVCDVEDLMVGVYIVRIHGTNTESVVCQRKFVKE